MTRRLEAAVLACSLSLVGLSVVALRALRRPASRLSRFVDERMLPHGVSR
ncbi:hypothetical protein [Blastococcus xanthinilyticus]|uniref:Uncharacterized protein n=1 Tax=Blastococcus xanthinilyticus TaxID=1564164 RepID=A0A5S5CLN4_9ACTN|nr:hypothetical protein [Blastococcus xanthinilyticus]TYP82030.1 hypothetical protein BD833_12014 [Blastococcus xanthinilyticus]